MCKLGKTERAQFRLGIAEKALQSRIALYRPPIGVNECYADCRSLEDCPKEAVIRVRRLSRFCSFRGNGLITIVIASSAQDSLGMETTVANQ